jgi:hypothetical protein
MEAFTVNVHFIETFGHEELIVMVLAAI